MKIEIKKGEIYEQKGPEVFGIEIIPENKEEHRILKRFWDGGVKTNGYSSSGQLQLTFADLIRSKETKKLSIDEIEHKINAMVSLLGITDDRLMWYLVGLIEGYKVCHNRQMKTGGKAVKLKGIDFFKAGRRGVTIKGGDALVLLGELKDGRSTTQVIPWDAIIEVKAEPYCPVVTCATKKTGEKMKMEQIEKLPSWEEQRKALKDANMRGDNPIECNCIPYKKWRIEKDKKITLSNVYPAKPGDFREYRVILVFNEKLETWQAEPLVEYRNVCPVCLKLMLVRAISGTTWLACCSKECYKKYNQMKRLTPR